MRRASLLLAVVVPVSCLLLTLAAAQEPVAVALQPTGAIQLTLMAGKPVILELNAHGPEWKYATQAQATAEVKDAPAGQGKVFTGRLAVPNTEGSVTFTETVVPKEKQIDLTYEFGFSQVMLLNGLQVSLILPAEAFAGKSAVVRAAEVAEPTTVALPETLDEAKWQLLPATKANQAKIAEGTDREITLTTDGDFDILIHDLRRWQRDEFEVRVALVAADQGQQVNAADTHTLKLSVAFARPVAVTGPAK